MQGPAGQKENLEIDAEFDGEPVKLFESQGNVVGAGGSGDDAGR